MTDASTQPSSSSQSTTNMSATGSHSSSSKPTSAINSPQASRDTSPVQKPLKTTTPSTATGISSRKNSHDHSPNRAPSGTSSNVPSVPSAAAVQRALSALGSPQIPTPMTTEPSADTARAKKHGKGAPGRKSPRWPTSPRLKSPPPSATSMKPSVFSPRNSDQGARTPNILIEHATPSPTVVTDISASTTDIESDDTTPRSGMRTPGRGVSGTGSTLETVQESSLPATPVIGMIPDSSNITTSNNAAPERITENPMEDAFTKSIRTNTESGSESGSNKNGNTKTNGKRGRKPASTSNSIRTTTVLPRKSLTHLNSPRSKAGGEGSVRNMTVETETVSSIPQVAVGGGAGERGLSGRIENGSSLRLKPSTETIRPKKEKKKGVRKTPSIISGTCGLRSTHKYLFTARLTPPDQRVSLLITDEDLESLPVPPCPSPPPQSLLTIRSGSVSSKADIFEAKVASAVDEAESTDSAESFMYESNPADSRRHIGRYGRGRGAGAHPSLLGSESPFPLAAREDDGADDERTPLLTSVRFRSRGVRRPYAVSVARPATRGWWARVAGWITLTVLAICLLSAVAGGLVGFSNPLRNVHVKDIRNVLASEPEIMLDLNVHAVNTNLLTIQVNDLDVNIFAKSKYVATTAWWRDHRGMPPPNMVDRKRRHPASSVAEHSPVEDPLVHRTTDGTDEGNDPIDDPEGDSQIMLLGRIFEFDSPLIFEASPLRHRSQSSVGELRLSKPGNETEEGGTERWEKVIQHPFELIVRGVLKYQLPLSSRVRTASIRASVIVHPDEGVDEMANMRASKTHTPDPPGSDMVVHRGRRYGVKGVGFVA